MPRISALTLAVVLSGASGCASTPARDGLFQTSDQCAACHNGLVTPAGEDVSIASDWKSTMMAHSARDPYWQAGVRRETMDHPGAQAAIEDECSTCHMPMARTQAKAEGRTGSIFAHLPLTADASGEAALAADGVSCTACHQITSDNLGTPASFTGGFVIDTTRPAEQRQIFGRFRVDSGRTVLMRSATGFVPSEGAHIRSSELCATCHTLITEALGPDGRPVGRLPEQVMYLEWQHSAFRGTQSCQSCHMPVVHHSTPISSVAGEPRDSVGRHVFVGGNFFMLRLLNRFRIDLGVVAPSRELDAAANRTVRFLQTSTASVTIESAAVTADGVEFSVAVSNLAGHKFPTGYPSRRAWLHVVVRDQGGRVVFESGALTAAGAIVGNENDADPRRFEPHRREVRTSDQVQIYESIMAGANGALTTGLLTATTYVKDNRLLPLGFDKATAEPDVAVIGDARADADFGPSGDIVRYAVPTGGATGPFTVDVTLRFQPISYRWAENLREYRSAETDRFSGYYTALSASSSETVARHTVTVR